jgi:hypothetical protein
MCVFRSVFSTRNAEYQVRAMGLGKIDPLRAGEVELAGQIASGTTGLDRAWEYWVQRLKRAGLMPT